MEKEKSNLKTDGEKLEKNSEFKLVYETYPALPPFSVEEAIKAFIFSCAIPSFYKLEDEEGQKLEKKMTGQMNTETIKVLHERIAKLEKEVMKQKERSLIQQGNKLIGKFLGTWN